jgi:hypothetical protein
MMCECEPLLVFLWHPGAVDRFSGYGLRVAPAHLIGVVMIDRPKPAASNWLEDIHQTFGGYDLVTMARDGARGIVCQMRIVEESRVHLRLMRHPQREQICQALRPLLAAPPAVTLSMTWDDRSGGWVSTIVRPPRFPLGQIVMTPGALRALVTTGQDPMEFVRRHQSGDWGDLSEDDRQENEWSLQRGASPAQCIPNSQRRANLGGHGGGPLSHHAAVTGGVLRDTSAQKGEG